MYKLIVRKDGISQYQADLTSDIAGLPTNTKEGDYSLAYDSSSAKKCAIGSYVLVLDSGSVYMLNTEGVWKEGVKLNSIGSGSGSGSGTVTYPSWVSGRAYNINEVVTYNGLKYQCIKTHTSNSFESDIANWMEAKEFYYIVTQSQYDYMEAQGTITDKTTDLYIIIDAEGNKEIVQVDWNEEDETSELYIKNKPTIPSVDGLVEKETGKGLSTNDYTTAEKDKLTNIEASANKYVHPTTTGNKHIPTGGSTGQILTWSADGTATWGTDKDTTYTVATTSANGLMSSTDKTKLDGVEASANKYVHPTTAGNKHIPSGGASGQVLAWSADGTAVWGTDKDTTYSAVTTTTNGLMISTDKTKLDGVEVGANKYVHPTTTGNKHIPTGGTTGQILCWDSDGTAIWGDNSGGATYTVATTSSNGLMSSTDKTKLDGVAEGANKYVHPTTTGNKHIPTGGATGQILQWESDGTAVWGDNTGGTAYSVATTTTDGLMASTDKTKLDGVAEGANKYVHPTTTGNKHIPSGGSTGQVLQWSADGTAVWGADKDTTYSAVTTSANGLMISTDKTKLDGVEVGANKTIIDTSLSSSSTNAIQNKVVNSAFDSAKTSNGYSKLLWEGSLEGAGSITVDTTSWKNYDYLMIKCSDMYINGYIVSGQIIATGIEFLNLETSKNGFVNVNIALSDDHLEGTTICTYSKDESTTYPRIVTKIIGVVHGR